MAALDHPVTAADRQPRSDHGARAFHRDPRPRAAGGSAPPGRRRAGSAELWRWHAIEEIEHKGVAYDTWLHATRDWPRSKRWKVKAKVMLLRHPQLRRRPDRGRDRAAAPGRHHRSRGLGAACSGIMWIRPGMMRKILGAWATYFLPGFHPWNEDDRHLIARL